MIYRCLPVLLLVGVGASTRSAQPHASLEEINPLAQFHLPDTNQYRFFLENRLTVFVVPDNRAPRVSFTAFIRGGTADDEQSGAAEMLDLMLRTRGPCWMAPGRFVETMDDLSAELQIDMSLDLTEVTFTVPRENATRGLRVFSGIVREPCIDQAGLDDYRATVAEAGPFVSPASEATGVASYEGSLETAVELFRRELYAAHDYGVSPDAGDASELSVEDVEKFHRKFFTPPNVTLAVSGRFEMGDMIFSVDQRFADWEMRRPPTFKRASRVKTPNPGSVRSYATDALRAWVVIGHEMPATEPHDYPALEVMNYILAGGQLGARVVRGTRDLRGSTHDAGSVLEPRVRGPGTYTFRVDSPPDAVEDLVRIVLREVERIRNEEVTDEELSTAIGALADGAFSMRFENGRATARTFAEEWARHVTLENLALYQQRIRDVSARDVRRAAQRFLHPERMMIVTLKPT